MSAVQIFSLPQVVMLTYGVGASTLNFPLNRTDIKLFRGLSNPVQILIRDVDRAPVGFAPGIVPVISIVQRDSLQVVYTSPLTLVDATQSLWTFTVGANDIADWDTQFLTYSVTILDQYGNRSALFMDRGYGLVGGIELIDGPFPPKPRATVLVPAQFNLQGTSLYSGAVPGAAQLKNLSGLHTLVVYGAGLTGSVTVQALLDPTMVTTDSQWINVAQRTYTDLDGLAYMNVEGNFYWIRVVVNVIEGGFTQLMVRS